MVTWSVRNITAGASQLEHQVCSNDAADYRQMMFNDVLSNQLDRSDAVMANVVQLCVNN